MAGKCQWGENFENFRPIGVPRLLLARHSSLMQLAGQEAIRGLTPNDIHAVAQRYLDPAQRLEITLSLVERRAGADPGLAAERRELFGASPGGGGLCGELAATLDALLLRLLS